MFCKKCGTQLESDGTFCGNCGAKVESLEHNPGISKTLIDEPAAVSKPNKKKKVGLIIGIIVFLAVLAAGGIYSYGNYLSPEARCDRYLELGQKYLMEENYEEAIIAFNKAIEIDDKRAEAYIGLAEAYEETGDIEKAMEILEKGYRKSDDEDLLEKLEDLQDTYGEDINHDNASRSETSDESSAAADMRWKDAYIDYVYSQMEDYAYSERTYALIYLDSDDIPELVRIGNCEADGTVICVYHDGMANPTQLSRLYFTFYEKGNMLCNSEGNMGYYYDVIYEMKDGALTEIAEGVYHMVMASDGSYELDESGNEIYQYEWNGKQVSKEEYDLRLVTLYDSSRAVDVFSQSCSAEEMINIIEAY